VKSLLPLLDPDDKLARAILAFGCSIAFIKIKRPVSWKHSGKSHEIASSLSLVGMTAFSRFFP